MEVKEEYQVKISNTFVDSESLDDDDDDDDDINSALKLVRKNMKEASTTENNGYYELKRHKPWSDEQCSKL